MREHLIRGRPIVALAVAGLVGLAGPAAAQTSTREVEKDAQQAERRTENERGGLSDAWLTAKTKLALLADEDVSGTSINVDTSNGVVTLKGEVESQAQKAKAMEIARSIEGVKQVEEQLVVKAEGTQTARGGAAPTGQSGAAGQSGVAKRDDDQIARDVRQAIQREWKTGELRLDGDTLKGPQETEIEVNVDDGVVTLDGKVKDVQDIVQAAQAARGVQGVRSVKTNIESGQPS